MLRLNETTEVNIDILFKYCAPTKNRHDTRAREDKLFEIIQKTLHACLTKNNIHIEIDIGLEEQRRVGSLALERIDICDKIVVWATRITLASLSNGHYYGI